FASATTTTCGVWSCVPTMPVRLSPELTLRDAAPPTVAVAVKVTGLPCRPSATAVSVSVRTVGPRTQDVTAAMPLASVDTAVVGATVPLPAAVANVTATPATGLPLASLTITDGGGWTAVPTCAAVPPAVRAIVAAVPAPRATGAEVTAARLGALKLSV